MQSTQIEEFMQSMKQAAQAMTEVGAYFREIQEVTDLIQQIKSIRRDMTSTLLDREANSATLSSNQQISHTKEKAKTKSETLREWLNLTTEEKPLPFENQDGREEWQLGDYAPADCEKCGRARVCLCNNGKHRCEKCNWSPELGGYAPSGD